MTWVTFSSSDIRLDPLTAERCIALLRSTANVHRDRDYPLVDHLNNSIDWYATLNRKVNTAGHFIYFKCFMTGSTADSINTVIQFHWMRTHSLWAFSVGFDDTDDALLPPPTPGNLDAYRKFRDGLNQPLLEHLAERKPHSGPTTCVHTVDDVVETLIPGPRRKITQLNEVAVDSTSSWDLCNPPFHIEPSYGRSELHWWGAGSGARIKIWHLQPRS